MILYIGQPQELGLNLVQLMRAVMNVHIRSIGWVMYLHSSNGSYRPSVMCSRDKRMGKVLFPHWFLLIYFCSAWASARILRASTSSDHKQHQSL